MKRWLDIILDSDNIDKALKDTIKKNSGTGIDGVTANQLKEAWENRGNKVIAAIYSGNYWPLPAKRMYINKGNGKKRKLTVPTMQDRMLQRCIVNVLGDYYENFFHENSFGFRKGRGTFEAIEKVMCYMDAGYEYIIDLDIENCFDTISHSLVMTLLYQKIKDINLLLLIKRYLRINVMCGRKIIQMRRGVAQGGPISSLLANIVLNELDWYLNSQNINFVRYADDVVMFCKSLKEAQKKLDNIKEYIEKQLELTVNIDKTNIVKSDKLEYLGMAFKKKGLKHTMSLSENIKKHMYRNLLKRFRRTHKKGTDFWDMIGGFHRGWINYYSKIERMELCSWLDEIQQYEDEITQEYIHCKPVKLQEKQIALINSKQYISYEQWLAKLKQEPTSSRARHTMLILQQSSNTALSIKRQAFQSHAKPMDTPELTTGHFIALQR